MVTEAHALGGGTALGVFLLPRVPCRCQWTLRGDADSVLSLTFRSFDVATCDERGSDLVTVYDTLSPVEPRAVVQ